MSGSTCAPTGAHSQPFGMIPAEIWSRIDVPRGAKIVLGGLVIIARHVGRWHWVRATLAEIASACASDVRTVRRGLAALDKAGVIAWDEIGRNFQITVSLLGDPNTPNLRLPDRQRGTCPARKTVPSVARKTVPPTIKKTEETKTTDASSSSSISSGEQQGQFFPASLIDEALSLYKGVDEDGVKQAISAFGVSLVARAIEIGVRRTPQAVWWGFVLRTCENLQAEQETAAAKMKKPTPAVSAPKVAEPAQPPGWKRSVPDDRDRPPTDEEIAEAIENITRTQGVPRAMLQEQLCRWVIWGHVDPARIGLGPLSCPLVLEPAKETPAGGPVTTRPPQPVGASDPRTPIIHECTSGANGNRPQRARQDSNLQPSDSKIDLRPDISSATDIRSLTGASVKSVRGQGENESRTPSPHLVGKLGFARDPTLIHLHPREPPP